jgi:hypothetical protein
VIFSLGTIKCRDRDIYCHEKTGKDRASANNSEMHRNEAWKLGAAVSLFQGSPGFRAQGFGEHFGKMPGPGSGQVLDLLAATGA